MKKNTIHVVGALFVAGAIIVFALLASSAPAIPTSENANNVTSVDGKQIVEITARGGYQPRTSKARAGLPTTIRFVTNGTFDCSSSVRIPSLNISRQLTMTGVTDIDIGSQASGTLRGSCGMGMYPFEIFFE